MSAPQPHELGHDLAEVCAQTDRVLYAYKWAYNRSLGSAGRGLTVGRSPVGESDPTGGVGVQTVRNDDRAPVGRVVAGQGRKTCEDAAKDVQRAFSTLLSAENNLWESLDRSDPPHEAPDSMVIGRFATRADVAAAREAQERRAENDQGFGEG